MSLQLSVAARNARLDAIEVTAGTAAKLMLYSGSVAANCAAAAPSGLLGTLTLPSDWMAAASAGSKALTGTWSGTASAAGTAASFRITDSAGTTCHIQGTVTITGSGGDMTLDNPSLTDGQAFSIATFALTDANA